MALGGARTVKVRFLGDISDLEAAMVRAGVIADVEGKRIGERFTAGTSRAAAGLTKLSTVAASWGIPFTASLDKAAKQLEEAHTRTARLSTTMAAAGGLALKVGAVGFAAAGVEATRMGEKFQTATASIANNAGISQKAAQDLGRAFLDTAGQSVFSGREMATAYAGVAGQLRITQGRALDNAQALRFMTAAGDLAEATQTDLATATSALAGVMQAYHLSVGQAADASNVLFNTSKATGTQVGQVAQAVDRMHGRLGALAPSLKDVATVMVAFAQHGLAGSRALMAVNTAFQTLVSPTKKVQEVLKAIGANVYDANGRFIGMQGAIAQLQPKLAGLNQQQQIFVAQTLFGKSAGQAMLGVIRDGVPAYQRAASAVDKHNAVQRAASAQSHTLHGDIKRLEAAVNDLGTKFGLFLIPKLTDTARSVANVIQWFGRHKAASEALAATITGVLGLAISAFAYTKAVAFVNATKNMIGGIGKLVTAAGEGAVAIASKFGLVGTSAGTMAAEVATADAGIASSSERAAAAVTAADDQMVASNAAAGRSFGLLLGKITAVVAALQAAQPLINSLTGGGLSGNDMITPTRQGLFDLKQGLAGKGQGTKLPLLTAAPRGGAESQIANFLTGTLGLSPVAAAGILGNFAQESGFNASDNGPSGLGIAQWMGGRRAAAEALARREGVAPNTLAVQLQYLAQELHGSYASVLAQLRNARSPQQAADIFMNLFERPAASAANAPNREAQAAAAYRMITGHAAPAGGGGGGGGVNSALQALMFPSPGGTGSHHMTAAQKARNAAQAKLHQLISTSNSLLAKLANAMQSGTVKTLTAALGITTAGRVTGLIHAGIEGLPSTASAHRVESALVPILTRAARGSTQEKAFEHDVSALRHSGQGGLARALVAAHKAAMQALAQQMYAQQVAKDAESLSLEGQKLRDQTTMEANHDQAMLDIAKAQQQKVVDAMQAQVTSIRDMTQIISDRFAGMVQAIEDATQAMSDANDAVVQGINDQTQIRVDILGERGLYGLNLIAQKLQVQADMVRAYWDQQIALARQNLDQVTAQWHAAVNAAQINLDQVQLSEDQLVAQSQAADDTAKIAQLSRIAAAQAHMDAVTLHMDTSVVGPAQTAVDINAAAPKAVQDVMAAQLRRAEGVASKGEAAAAKQFESVYADAQQIINAADSALASVQGNAEAAIANAQQTLTTTQGEANAAIATATQTLTSVQGQAGIAEASATGAASVAGAQASTQFAGGGLVVNMYGIPMNDAASVTGALDWFARNTLSLSA